MSDRSVIVPDNVKGVVQRYGYAPAVRIGNTLYCAGQVGRTEDLQVIDDPEEQFVACWNTVRSLLEERGSR